MARSGDTPIGLALAWVVGILSEHRVRYQVVGGLAAQAHGSTRALADIDVYAPLSEHPDLVAALAPHATWGPAHFRDASWDLVFMKLVVFGQRVEIGDSSSSPRYFDRRSSCWVDQIVDFARSERHVLYGVEVDVMPAADLVAYKDALGREVDHQDIVEMTRVRGPR